MTVCCWGMYGILLHQGAMAMQDPEFGRLKAFVVVGAAYMLVAVLAPLGVLLARGASMSFDPPGIGWSLAAGTVGAIGALGVLLAFGAGGRPPTVMTLVFAGAPVINAVVGVTMAGRWGEVRWPFVLGIVLAISGASLVGLYKPAPAPTHDTGH